MAPQWQLKTHQFVFILLRSLLSFSALVPLEDDLHDARVLLHGRAVHGVLDLTNGQRCQL